MATNFILQQIELARTLGILLQKGWRPRRTIILASWDAEEYGLVGSTEWVEDHASWLKNQAVTYINGMLVSFTYRTVCEKHDARGIRAGY